MKKELRHKLKEAVGSLTQVLVDLGLFETRFQARVAINDRRIKINNVYVENPLQGIGFGFYSLEIDKVQYDLHIEPLELDNPIHE